MREYKEFSKLTSVETNALSELESDIEDIQRCSFVNDLAAIKNEKIKLYAITTLERILKIKSPAGSIQERIDRIIAKWSDNGVYTKNTLPIMLRALLGNNFYIDKSKRINALSLNNFAMSGYEIYLTVHYTAYWQKAELKKLLDTILPANIVVQLTEFDVSESSGNGNIVIESDVRKEER